MINSFDPIENDKCKILILGTMPSEESLNKGQYYANTKNQFWRIIYDVYVKKMG